MFQGKGEAMYGTVARTQVKPGNRDKLREVFSRQPEGGAPAGFISAYTLFENEGETAWLFAVFEDRASYDKNADDPRQNEQYMEYRALMEIEPEWHDGEIEGM